ncbi:hypothetical protein BA065_01720 [Nanoarchaeota archaeon NZ13-N]|uniref:DUF3006 domain-containing protein n=1 Tax=Candidatus Nanoclepta minutus TaxID=1940235 RepID=A0A397WQX4_9ARCH|nr:MAG: hypothetical protein BA065_01720 [Nanoarchaeota archaeon NZ13-N]RIB35473.1 MAG: hypothetical protein BXU00_01770 [Candidatus Nanoclepta minutus]
MYEGFLHLNEGLIYGVIREIKKDRILVEAGGERKYYDLEAIPMGISEGDYVRLFVRDGKVFFIEKLSREEYEEFRRILEDLIKLK